MAVQFKDLDLLEWQFHDAAMHDLKLSWQQDGSLSLSLRCTVNPEENIDALTKLGIHSSSVEIEFKGVSQLHTDVPAVCSSREVILDWEHLDGNPLHHRIRCSCGSLIEVTFEEVWLHDTVLNQ
jgi:hypothetical protein